MANSQQFIDGLDKAKAVLKALAAAGFPEANVSGGYLRDLYLGRKPKDMDVFIASQPSGDTGHLERNLSDALGVNLVFQCNLGYGADTEIARVFTEVPASDTHGVPVQVIELATGLLPSARYVRYDFGLCQITMGVDGAVALSRAFYRDFFNQTCTLAYCTGEAEHARSMRRWDRWAAEFATLGIKLVDNTQWARPRLVDAEETLG